MEERRKAKTGVEPVGIRATELIRTLSMSSDDAPLVECVKRHEMRPPSGETARSLDDHLGAPPSLPNLDSFFTYTTPCVPMRRDGTSKTAETAPSATKSQGEASYRLQDVWDAYEEWSAYGAEVPLVMENGEQVLQYYVPYLSAMQLFTHTPPRASITRSISLDSHEGDILCESDVSDGDSCGASDGCSSGFSSKASSEAAGSIGDSDSLESTSDDGDHSKGYKGRNDRSSQGGSRTGRKPLFEYYEVAAPYTRSPLAAKVAELAQRCPALLSTCTTELDPSSWLSVAWYPIYRIPTGRTLRDLHACFLTFHALVPPNQPEGRFAAARQRCPAPPPRSEGAESLVAQRVVAYEARLGPKQAPNGCVALSPFGFAAYKMSAEVWAAKDKSAAAPHEAMYNQARFFLSQRNLRHPDFEWFLKR